jgi:hypothetical protein
VATCKLKSTISNASIQHLRFWWRHDVQTTLLRSLLSYKRPSFGSILCSCQAASGHQRNLKADVLKRFNRVLEKKNGAASQSRLARTGFSPTVIIFSPTGIIVSPTGIIDIIFNFVRSLPRSHVPPSRVSRSAFRVPRFAFRVPRFAFRVPRSAFRVSRFASCLPNCQSRLFLRNKTTISVESTVGVILDKTTMVTRSIPHVIFLSHITRNVLV